MAVSETVEGEVLRVTFESAASGFRVVKIAVDGRDEVVTAIGTFPPVAPGIRLRVSGKKESDPRHGEQIRAESVLVIAPSTLSGIERFLGSGAIRGVGETYAKRIVEAFGLETFDVLDRAPERLREVSGLGKKRAAQLVESYNEQRGLRDVMVFLQTYGVPAPLALRVHKRYGGAAMEVVTRTPYRLAVDVWGIGFRTADAIAMRLGVEKDSPYRMQAAAVQALRDLTDNGHLWSSQEEVVARAALLLGAREDAAMFEAPLLHAVGALSLGSDVVREERRGEVALYLPPMHKAERRFAARVGTLMETPVEPLDARAAVAKFENETGVALSDEQRSAVSLACRSPLVVITGGPGVGKTTILRALLAVYDAFGVATRLAAPTGRAAKRMSEATGHAAGTVHRLLEFEPKQGGFQRNMNSPIDARAVVVDESSMLDMALADSLLDAIAAGTRVVLVGDVDQLPSVGPGAVLRDVIASGSIPCVRLTHIYRQAASSLIVTNAHKINAGLPPVAPPKGDTSSDFFMMERTDPESARDAIRDLAVSHIPRRFGMDPIRDVQVLTPMQKGPAGAIALNVALQSALNPDGPSIARGAQQFRRGDKVMQRRNDYDRTVWNGDMGFVKEIDQEGESLVVTFDGRDVPYDSASLEDLTLAYACTVHKSQGSEYRAVIVPLLTAHFMMLTRNLLYTAVTRAKKLVVLVYDPKALEIALSADRRDDRRTSLRELLANGVPL